MAFVEGVGQNGRSEKPIARLLLLLIAATALSGCKVCHGQERLSVIEELDAATVDFILHTRKKAEVRCELACDYGVKLDQGEEYSVLSLDSCTLDVADDYVKMHPDDPTTGPARETLLGARIACEGTSFVEYAECG